MRIRNIFVLISIIILLRSNSLYAQLDSSVVDSNKITFDPQYSGTHFEICYLLPIGIEVGGLLDMDLIRNKKAQFFSLGYRVSFEYYSYIDFVEGRNKYSYLDLCLYVRPALRFNWFWINALGGYAYHKDIRHEESELSPRIGLEFKFNVFRKYVALLLKSSFSFQSESGFFGFGIALGYFN